MKRSRHAKQEFRLRCRQMLDEFSSRFPDEAFHFSALQSLEHLVAQRNDCYADPGGWTGGLLYMIAKHNIYVSHPRFHNRDLEEVFGVSMDTIRKRAVHLWPVVFPDVFTT